MSYDRPSRTEQVDFHIGFGLNKEATLLCVRPWILLSLRRTILVAPSAKRMLSSKSRPACLVTFSYWPLRVFASRLPEKRADHYLHPSMWWFCNHVRWLWLKSLWRPVRGLVSPGRSSSGSSIASFLQSRCYTRCPVTASTPKPDGRARCVSGARRDPCGGGEKSSSQPRPLRLISHNPRPTVAALLAEPRSDSSRPGAANNDRWHREAHDAADGMRR
jgi:hypothetical protein